VTVVLDGKEGTVELSAPLRETGSTAIALTDVWKAAWPSVDPSPLLFDLVGSDGFHPTSRPKCTRLLRADEIARMRLDVASHDVSLDDGLTLPGCYRVRAVVSILAVR
jgi:hypothetical protein